MNISNLIKAQKALDQINNFEDRHGNLHKMFNSHRERINNSISASFSSNMIEMNRITSELNKRNQTMLSAGNISTNFHNTLSRLNEISNTQISATLFSSIENIKKIADEHLNALKEISLFSTRNSFSNPVIESAIFAGSLRLNEIEALRNNTLNVLSNEKFRSVLTEFQKSINNAHLLENINVLRNSYFGNLAHAFRDAIESSVNEEEAMEKVEAMVEEKLAETPENTLFTQDTLKTIIALLSLIATLYFGINNLTNSKQSSETQQLRYKQLLKVIEKIVENTNPNTDGIEVYYVVEREFDVRTKPNFQAIKFSRLYPNTKVKLIVEKHKWIYVEWTDYLEAVPRYGWVNKKYLKKLN